MQATETRTRLNERPRINIRESEDECGESWSRDATMLYSDIVRIVGPEPTDPCERSERYRCGSRRPCAACEARGDWADAILAIVREATDWGLYGYNLNAAYSPTGRPFAHEPAVYRHARHPKVVCVTWSGGLDI